MNVMPEHTVKAFGTELQELGRKVAEMGGFVEQQISDALSALTNRDLALARHVIGADTRIDALQHEIEEKAILTLARRQPMAIDLREIIAALRVANDLERIGDYAKNIGKRVVATRAETRPLPALRGLRHMADLVLAALKHVLDAYARRDVAQALAVWRGDEAIDVVNNALFSELMADMMADPRNIAPCTHLLFCAKNIERMGDHATNIAETVYYIVEGVPLDTERPKAEAMGGAAPAQ
jgi:phosphate transport system protein